MPPMLRHVTVSARTVYCQARRVAVRPCAASISKATYALVCTWRPAMADSDMTWAKMDPDHVPPEIDTTRPSVARVYDAILGGRDNFAVDRAVAAEAVKTM